MASPFVRTDALGRILSVSGQKSTADLQARAAELSTGSTTGPGSTLSDEPNFGGVPIGGSVTANIDATGDVDLFSVNLTAGQTYLFSMRGTGGTPLNDSLLALFGPSGGTPINIDDDGGNGTYSLITYTATANGTYTLYAAAFDNGDEGTGQYTIDVRQQDVDSVGSTNATSVAINLGTTFGFRETGTDVDRYSIQLEAGKIYSFGLAGGADYGTNPNAVPTGELDTILRLRDANGTLISSNDDISFPADLSSGLSFVAQTSGTYYLDVTAYSPQTGAYALDVKAQNLSDFDPLESLIWDRAANVPFDDVGGVPTAYVYFAPAGTNFGELADDGVTPMTTFGWLPREIAAVMSALGEFEKILGVNYEITNDVNQATFRLMTTSSDNYGAYFYPQDPAYGTQQGIGVFNVDSGGWFLPQSLEKGGFAYAVILHEFGHAHGLSHPHDRGGGSEVMLGVTSSTGSLGVFNLNQGVYTVMSYNDAWPLHPDGGSSFSFNGIDNGWSGTLSAFDIAALQQRYGVTPHATGNDVYTLTDVTDDAFYQTIWDSGGNDTIAYNGALNAQIDLTAATLDYSATGGGVVSFLYNLPTTTPASAEIKGGFTIAGGVVIENATGGSGNDALIGNAAANVLRGNGGNDVLMGRGGNDYILGGAGIDRVLGGDGLDVVSLGAGNDIFVAELGAKVSTKAGGLSYDVITDFDGGSDDVIDLSGLGQTFNWRSTDANKRPGDLSYKTYSSINGAEKALGIEIDGNSGASGIGGPVTVVFGNMADGGSPDFAIVLLNTRSVDKSDFLFATPASGSSLAAQNAAMSFASDDIGSKYSPLFEAHGHAMHADYLIA
jgi:hypothetical protein